MPRLIDLTGKQFGGWKVLNGPEIIKRKTYWFCECKCKKRINVLSHSLIIGSSKGCKSCSKSKYIDLTGKKFGDWIVLYKSENKNNNIYWFCECKCGKQKNVNSKFLKSGQSTKCLFCYAS